MTRIAVQVYPPALRIRRHPPRLPDSGGGRRGPRLYLGPFLSAVRRLRWRALRVFHARCSRRSRRRRPRSASGRSSPATRTVTRNCSRTWPRTIDHVSGGRFILGIGSGWFERDYDEYGYEFGTGGEPAEGPRGGDPAHEGPARQTQPAAEGSAAPDDRGREARRSPCVLTAEHADIWHGFASDSTRQAHAGRTGAAQERGARRLVREDRGGDPEIHRPDHRRGRQGARPGRCDRRMPCADEITVGAPPAPSSTSARWKEWLAWRDARGAR